MESRIWKPLIAVGTAALVTYFGSLAIPVVILITMMIIDYVSGLAYAWVQHTISSKIGAKGIIKKVGYMALIGVAIGVDYLIYTGVTAADISIGYEMWFALLVTIWLIINEMISILENLSKLGVPIPGFLTAVIQRLKTSTESKERKD